MYFLSTSGLLRSQLVWQTSRSRSLNCLNPIAPSCRVCSLQRGIGFGACLRTESMSQQRNAAIPSSASLPISVDEVVHSEIGLRKREARFFLHTTAEGHR